MKRWAGQFLVWIGAMTLLGVCLAVPVVRYSKNWLATEVPLAQADWIVVLGGESSQRVIGAAELYHQGIAPRVFVTGDGDCDLIERRLTMAGVPEAAISKECLSNSTYENALYTRQTLAPLNPQRLVLVTSWSHSWRALRTFRRAWPDVEWGMHIVYPGPSLRSTPAIYEAGPALTEYVKIAVYEARAWWETP